GYSEVADTMWLQHTIDLSQVICLSLGVSHMLDDMIGDDYIVLLRVKRQLDTLNFMVFVIAMHLPVVIHVYGSNLKCQIWMCCEVVSNAAGAAANLQQPDGLGQFLQVEQAFYFKRF